MPHHPEDDGIEDGNNDDENRESYLPLIADVSTDFQCMFEGKNDNSDQHDM